MADVEAEAEVASLLPERRQEPLVGAVDYHGRPIYSRCATGGWTSAFFIIGVEITERFAFYGIGSNLITYLTGPLGQSTAGAAAAINAWSGAASLLPLLGAFVADAFLGRYRTIVFASVLYILGLSSLSISSLLSGAHSHECNGATDPTRYSSPTLQLVIFYLSLYLVAFAQGGHKPCVQAFGADQFDQNDPKESVSRSSFFNWWYFGMLGGNIVTLSALNYIQENVGWVLGFVIPCIAMLVSLLVFLLGTRTYRFYIPHNENMIARISKSIHNPARAHPGEWNSSDVGLVIEAKQVLRLFPVWATCLTYAVIFAQWQTFFTKQASTLDRRIGSKFLLPAAVLQSFINVAVVTFIPIYDRVIVPLARRYTNLPTGITMLQRIGSGMIFSLISMVVAALIEMKRLQTARDFHLVDDPAAPIPMSLWWMVPQFVLTGISDVFTMVGLQEFFYDQVPNNLRSFGLALYLSIFGAGSFISSFLIFLIDKLSISSSGESWFSDNLNRAHLDYFYWFLAALGGAGFILFTYFTRSYVYERHGGTMLR